MSINKEAINMEKMTSRNMEPKMDEFIPETEFGRELWALRQKAIAEGMALLTGEEISDEISAGRDR
jgi:hypothetical protein